MGDSDKEKKKDLKQETKKDSEEDSNLSSGELKEVGDTIEKLSRKEPKLVSEFMSLAKMGSMPNPIHDKLTENHIDKIVELAVKHDERQYDLYKTRQNNDHNDKQSDKKYHIAYFVIGVAVFLTVMILFKDNPEVLIPTLTGLGGLVSGFLAGLGFRKKGDNS